MEKDGARSLPSQSLIEGGPCFRPCLRNCTHKLQPGQLLGRTTRTCRPHRLLLQLRPWISVIYQSSHTTLLRAIRSLLSAHLSRNSEAASIFKTYFWPLVHFIHIPVYHGFLSTHPLFLDCNPQGRTIPLIHFISHHLSPVFLHVPTLLVFYVPRPYKLTLSFLFLFFTRRIALHLTSLLL